MNPLMSMFLAHQGVSVHLPLGCSSPPCPGTNTLPKLFTSTLVGAVIMTPLTSMFLSRQGVGRDTSLRQFYTFLAAMLLGACSVVQPDDARVGALLMSRARSGAQHRAAPVQHMCCTFLAASLVLGDCWGKEI